MDQTGIQTKVPSCSFLRQWSVTFAHLHTREMLISTSMNSMYYSAGNIEGQAGFCPSPEGSSTVRSRRGLHSLRSLLHVAPVKGQAGLSPESSAAIRLKGYINPLRSLLHAALAVVPARQQRAIMALFRSYEIRELQHSISSGGVRDKL